jgi:alkyl hydroperoxide reductase subunit AhpC
LAEFRARGAEVVAVSTDSKFSHKAWLQTPRSKGGIEGCRTPILADFTKKVSAAYDVLQEASGVAVRGLFIIDPEGVVQSVLINNLPIGRNADEVLRLLDAIQHHRAHGEVCPLGWKKGDEAIKPAQARNWFEKRG